jgi:predicted AlkP superfamily pyrophosphatase or phosphodiesterase
MKRVGVLIGFVLVSLTGFTQPAKHVILISIDGLRPEFYLDPSWPAPNLQKLKDQGVYAKGVRSVFPSVTYPSHTTLVTGAYPARHGIYYNVVRGGKKGQWYWEENFIKVPTLWDAVRQAGLTSGAVMWPVTVGAPIDYNFPVRRADGDEETNQLDITLPYVTPKNLVSEIEKETGKLTAADFNGNHSIDITIGKMGAYILKTHKPNLMALHFITVDHAAHTHGRDHQTTKEKVALVDSMIGEVMKTVKDAGMEKNTAIIITGDHGFVNSTHVFSPNVLLAQQGLSGNGEVSFQGAGGAAFLYLKNQADVSLLEKVKAALNALPPDQKKAFRIVERSELDNIGVNPEVAMALAMSKGYIANNEAKGPLIKPKKGGGNHGYFPDFDEINTGFIAVGAGIGTHKEIPSMGIKDVAPVISRLLNLSHSSPDGVLIPGILKQ